MNRLVWVSIKRGVPNHICVSTFRHRVILSRYELPWQPTPHHPPHDQVAMATTSRLSGESSLDERASHPETIEQEDRGKHENRGDQRSFYNVSDSHCVSLPFSFGIDSVSSSSIVSKRFLELSSGGSDDSCLSWKFPGFTS